MIKNKRIRRTTAISLMALGGLLMLFAPGVEIGIVMLVVGVILEIVGITLEHKEV